MDENAKKQYLQNHPELRMLAGRQFGSSDELQAVAKARGIQMPADAWKFFQNDAARAEPISSQELAEQSAHKEGSHHIHFHHNGQNKTIDAGKAYQNIAENTVSDWNHLHRNNPELQIKGKIFLKGANGDMLLNPEIAQKIPNFHEQARGIFVNAFGENALSSYQKWLETAPYKNPANDPVLQRLDQTVRTETERRIQEREQALRATSGQTAKLSDNDRKKIEREVRQNAFNAEATNHVGKFKSYSKRRFGGKIGWINDAWSEYEKMQKQQDKANRALYRNSAEVKTHLEKGVQDEIEREINRRQEADKKLGINRDRSFYETQIDKNAIAKKVRGQEARALDASTRGIRGFFARRSGIGRELLAEQKLTEKEAEKTRQAEQKAYAVQLKEANRLATIRDPRKDSYLQSLRSSLPVDAEAEFQRQKKQLTDQIRTQNAKSIQQHYLPEEAKKQIRDFESQRGVIAAQMKQQRYEELFKDMSQKQINQYTRKDAELKSAYATMQEKEAQARKKRDDAVRLTQKRSLRQRALQKINPFRGEPILFPSQRAAQSQGQSRYRRYRSNVSSRFDPVRNHYDAFRDRTSELNQKYNPYERARRRLRELNEKYNPLNKLQDELRKFFGDLKDTARQFAKQATKNAGRAALSGARGLGRGGLRAGGSLARPGARAAAGVTSELASGAAQLAARGIFANPYVLGGIIIVILLFFIITSPPGDIPDTSGDGASGKATCSTGETAVTTDSGETKCVLKQDQALLNIIQPLAMLRFSLPDNHAYAQDDIGNVPSKGATGSIGNEDDSTSGSVDTGFDPKTDVVHRLRVTYGKPASDILVSYPIQSQVCLIAASPAPNESFTPCQNPSTITWSIKKVLNPGKTAAELAKITLQPPIDVTFKLTLRPRSGVKNVYIVSQATLTVNPASGSTGNSGTSGSIDTGTGSSNGTGCTRTSDPISGDWTTVNSRDSLITQKVNEVNQVVGVCVPVNLIKALIYEESGGEMLAVNGAGYGGIMQVGVGSNCDHGKYDIFTLDGNVGCGVEHLAHGYTDCNTWEGTVTAYYAGHCIPDGSADDPADGGSGETDYQYQQKIIDRWHELDSL